jgi:GAF domain-containing protein
LRKLAIPVAIQAGKQVWADPKPTGRPCGIDDRRMQLVSTTERRRGAQQCRRDRPESWERPRSQPQAWQNDRRQRRPNDPRTAAPETLRSFESRSISAFLAAPLVKDDRLVAVVSVHSRIPRTWSAAQAAVAEDVAERTWSAIERARAEEALRDSESRYRLLFRSIDESFTVVEPLYDEEGHAVDYRFLEVNPAFEAITGLRGTLNGGPVASSCPAWKRTGSIDRQSRGNPGTPNASSAERERSARSTTPLSSASRSGSPESPCCRGT